MTGSSGIMGGCARVIDAKDLAFPSKKRRALLLGLETFPLKRSVEVGSAENARLTLMMRRSEGKNPLASFWINRMNP
jgi:hypothetical protein